MFLPYDSLIIGVEIFGKDPWSQWIAVCLMFSHMFAGETSHRIQAGISFAQNAAASQESQTKWLKKHSGAMLMVATFLTDSNVTSYLTR